MFFILAYFIGGYFASYFIYKWQERVHKGIDTGGEKFLVTVFILAWPVVLTFYVVVFSIYFAICFIISVLTKISFLSPMIIIPKLIELYNKVIPWDSLENKWQKLRG